MEIIDKLSLLNLSEKEEKKAREKFMATLSLISEDEIRDILDLLNSKGIRITKANEIKILANSKEEILKKFSILEEIHEEDIYKEDPLRINKNVIDIYKKIKYCIQNGIEYKNQDEKGYKYNKALFNEQLWAQLIASQNVSYVKEEDLVTLNPKSDYIVPNDDLSIPIIEEEPKKSNVVSFSEIINNPVEEPIVNNQEDNDVIDFNSYFESLPSMYDEPKKTPNIEDGFNNLNAETSNIVDLRADLERQFAELEKYKTDHYDQTYLDNNIIGINDIEEETFAIGGRAS